MWIGPVLLGLAVGILVGLMGIGGGILLVPALVYLMRMDQHLAQGTSLFLQLPPIGAGALYLYWKQGHVHWRTGLMCAAGFLFGGYFGSVIAIHTPANHLRGMFGVFLMVSALFLWPRSGQPQPTGKADG